MSGERFQESVPWLKKGWEALLWRVHFLWAYNKSQGCHVQLFDIK